MKKYFVSLDSIRESLQEAGPNVMIRLVLNDRENERYELDETIFVPLGHNRYVQIFRNRFEVTCHPGSISIDECDLMSLTSAHVKIFNTEEVVQYIARTIYENMVPEMHTNAYVGIGKDIYEEGEGFESDCEKFLCEYEEMNV